MSGFPNVPLRELIVEIQNGLSKRRGEHGVPTPVLRLADIAQGEIDESEPREIPLTEAELAKYALRDGDLVCVRVNGSKALVGRMIPFRANRTWAYCDHFIRLRPNRALVDDRYLRHFFDSRSARRRIELEMVSSAGQNTVSQGTMLDIQVPLPDLPRQHAIAAEIEKQFSRLDETIISLQRVEANLNRYKASVLATAVEGRLVANEANMAREQSGDFEHGSSLTLRVLRQRRREWNARKPYSEPAEPLPPPLTTMPQGWSCISLEAATSANRVICYGILMPKENIPDGVPYVKVRDMRGDIINVDSLQRTSKAIAAQYARASLRHGDLLLSIRGTYGRVAEVPADLEGGNITQDTARLDVSTLLSRRFMALYLRSETAQRYFKSVARGVAVKGVNIGDLRPMPIPVPPLAEQERIADEVDRRLSIVRELETEVDANLKRAQTLRQAVLAKAFSGEHA